MVICLMTWALRFRKGMAIADKDCDCMNLLFFELIQVAIGRMDALSRVPSVEEWGALYGMSVKQAVAGVCFCGVQRLPKEQREELPRGLMMQWFALAEQIRQRNEVMNRRCVEVQQMLAREGMGSCILKGQGVARLYDFNVNDNGNLGAYRQSGDIDVWVDASREWAIDYVMKTVPTREFDQKHIHFHVFEDLDVEMHWVPVKRDSPKFDRILGEYFKKESSWQFANRSGEVCYPTVDFQLVHQLLHVYAHYVYEGVGLRQMMDLYFAQVALMKLAHEKRSEVLDMFDRLGLMKFVAGTQYVLNEVFGLEVDALLCAPDEKEGQLLLKEIETGGNFGQYDKRNNVKDETFAHRALRRFERRWRMVRFDPLGTILMPFSRLRLEIWMRRVRRKYGV